MAEGDGVVYNTFKELLMEQGYPNFTTASKIKVALFTSSYTPDKDTDLLYSGLSNECSGTGYTAGGEFITTPTVVMDAGLDRGKFDGDDLTWSSLGPLTPDPNWAVMYEVDNSRLICYWDVGTTNPNGGDWKLQWGTNGILYIG